MWPPPTKHEAGLRDRDAKDDGEPTSQVGGDDGEEDARIAHGFGDQPQSPHTPPHNRGDPVDSSKAQRSQSEPKSIWL